MRINKFKRYIASLVSASMGVSLLAPQIPVWADTTTTRTIHFDLGKYTQFTGITLPDILTNETGLLRVSEALADRELNDHYGGLQPDDLPADTLANLQDTKTYPNSALEMPWWNYKWIAAATGANTNAKRADSYEAAVKQYIADRAANLSPTPPARPEVSWAGLEFNFPGYRLVGWTENTGVEDRTINKLPEYFPYNANTTYKAHYKSDGTQFKIKTNHVAGTDKAPVNTTEPVTNTVSVEVFKTTDESYQTPVINIPGYKISADSPAVTIENVDAAVTRAVTDTNNDFHNAYEVYGWTRDDDGHLQGQVFNKNVELTYTYIPDENRKFSVNQRHIILNENGSERSTTSQRSQFYAEQSITGVGPLASLITAAPGNTQARYILVTQDSTDTARPLEKAPKVTSGITSNPSGHITALEPTSGSYFDGNHNLIGKMPNQNVNVEYVYKPNPDYRLNVEVRYVDANGNSLTSKVLEEMSGTFPDLRETRDNAVVLELGPNERGELPFPELDGYQAPMRQVVTNPTEAGTVTEDRTNHKLTVTMDNSSYAIKVTYPKDPSRWGTILFDSTDHATLVDRDNEEEYISANAPVEAELEPGSKAVITQEVANTFPKIKPSLGYRVLGYFDGENLVADEEKHVTPNPEDGSQIYELEGRGTPASYKLTAKVEKDGLWRDYILEYDGGENGSMSETPKTISLYPNDEHGNPRTLTWEDITNATREEFVGLVPDTTAEDGYEIRWYDENNNQLITSGRDQTNILDYLSGTSFIAKAVSTAPLSVNTPSLTTEINPSTGNVELKFTTINPDPRVNYVITDANGDIVKVINASNLNDSHKILSDSSITPGNNYKVYEVMPGATIGDNISETPEADRSAETDITTPVALDPNITIEPNGTAKTVFEPVTPGMDYAIINSNRDVVIPWTTPSGTSLVLEGLEPDSNYTLVVKPSTDPAAETSRLPGLDFTTVAQSTNNKIRLINPADIDTPEGLDLNNVRLGANVLLTAHALNTNGDFFRGGIDGWEIVYGNVDRTTIASDGSTRFEFTMPRGIVVIRAIYGAASTSVRWEPATVSDAQGRPEDIATSHPDISDSGEYRVFTERKDATPSNASALSNERETVRGLFQIRSKVQRKNRSTEVFEDYTAYTGEILTVINTGALSRDNKEYKLYELVAGSDPVVKYTLKETDYANAQFIVNLENNQEYMFAYSEGESYKILVKDSRNDLNLASIKIRYDAGPKSLSDYSSRILVPVVGTESIGRDGVRYTYKGLSSSATSFEEVDTNLALSQEDTTIYAYYEDDSTQRRDTEDDLRELIDNVNSLNSKNRIKNTLDEATSILNQFSPRKATKEELQAAFDNLKAALDSLTPINNGGSSSGGASGSSNTGAKSTGTTTGLNNGITWYRTYSVGTDGSWKLLDKDNHVWAFESNDGTRVVGWANLAYTYNGVRRVETYHFRADGIMDYGWFKDENGKWFYMSEEHDGFFGHLIRGWYKDEKDGKWYYLSPIDGHMHTGWNNIKNVWYFLHPQNNVEPTWKYNESTHKWEYIGNASVRPLGAMYENERTPDNYFVDENGAWVEGK